MPPMRNAPAAEPRPMPTSLPTLDDVGCTAPPPLALALIGVTGAVELDPVPLVVEVLVTGPDTPMTAGSWTPALLLQQSMKAAPLGLQHQRPSGHCETCWSFVSWSLVIEV